MEGLIFFWISWLFWIMATFFMKRGSEERFKLSLSLLLLIIVSPIVISVSGFKLSLSSLYIYIVLFLFLSKHKGVTLLHIFFCSFIMTLAYICFQIYEFFDPVWVVFPRNWMLSIIIVVLAISLQVNKLFRIYILLLGMVQGDFLYAIILKKYLFPYTVSSFSFLDVAALSTGLLVCWNSIEVIAQFFAKHYHQIEKQKQKLL